MNRIGNVARHSSVTCQLSASIAMPTTTTLIMFETVLDSVEVNARCAPMTSLLSRETRAPVWVRVKNASDMRCTWANTLVRRSKIRPSPMREDSQPMPTASAGVEDRHACCRQRQADDERGVVLEDAVVDDVLDQQRGHDDEGGVDDGQRKEDRDPAPVRLGEADDPADGVARQLLLGDAPVGAHVTPHRTHAGSHGHLLTSSATPPTVTPARGTCAPAPRARRAAERRGRARPHSAAGPWSR